MPDRLVYGNLQFGPNNWSTNTNLCPTGWPTEFSSSGQTTGLRIELVYNWSTNTSLSPTDWSTEFSSSGQTTGLLIPVYVYVQQIGQWNSSVQAKQLVYRYNWSTTSLRIPVYVRPISQRISPVHAKQLVYEYNWSTTGRIPVYAQPTGQWNRNSPVQAKQLVYEYNWSTTGLRIPVYTQPIE